MQVDESGKVVDLARNNSVVGVAVRGAAGYDLLQVKPGEQQHLNDCPVDGSRLEWFKATLRKPGSPAVANPGPVESPGIDTNVGTRFDFPAENRLHFPTGLIGGEEPVRIHLSACEPGLGLGRNLPEPSGTKGPCQRMSRYLVASSMIKPEWHGAIDRETVGIRLPAPIHDFTNQFTPEPCIVDDNVDRVLAAIIKKERGDVACFAVLPGSRHGRVQMRDAAGSLPEEATDKCLVKVVCVVNGPIGSGFLRPFTMNGARA